MDYIIFTVAGAYDSGLIWGLTMAVPTSGTASSTIVGATTIVPIDGKHAAEPDPRSSSVSPSIAAAGDNARVHAAHKPTVAFVNEREAHQHIATDPEPMANSLDHALSGIMIACNVESRDDKHAADALSHDMEVSNVEAPVLDNAAVNGANLLDANLAERAGVLP